MKNPRPSRNFKEASSNLSVGQIAKELGLSPRTVSRLIDSGDLPGWRVPGSSDRRVARAAMETFARRHSIPLRSDPPKLYRKEILLVSLPQPTVLLLLQSTQAAEGQWGFTAADSLFDAGVRFGRDGFCSVVAYGSRLELEELAKWLNGASLVAILPEDQSVLPPVAGSVATLQSPPTLAELLTAIEQAAAFRGVKKGEKL